MEVRLLGSLEVRDDSGQPVAVTGGRQRTLLALLALRPGAVTPADRLIDDLWWAKAPQQPANALQIVVFKLRRAIGADVIDTRPPGYSLVVAAEDVDAIRFERLVHDGRAALAEDRPAAAIGSYDEALALWRGAALLEFGDVPTAVAAAARLEELRASASEDRFDALLATGRHAELIADLDTAIAVAPFRERLRGQLMLALYRSGRQADALRTYRDARRVLADELGLDPGGELRRLEAAILGQDPSLDLPGPTVVAGPDGHAATPTNLRSQLTSFVGRERDVAGVRALLAEHRLVTLVGAGGCGKTRLAAEVAAGQIAASPDGVWFAPLDALASGEGVPAAVADALGLSTADTAGQPALAATASLDRLRDLLTERSALVVLDNCEHVIDDAARLAEELLTSAPRLRLLATSREALRVPGEMVWSVPPLDTADAVSLFVARAGAVTSQFEANDTERTVVAELCELLDGMPLAIELTAARTRAFTVAQLAARLDDRFRLLTGGARTALPRQQTLRAVTDWSYDLLFDDERTVFERLSVFAGGCTLEAAEAVCADERLSAADVGGLIGRLVDKSLLVADGRGRYRLLLTLAHYGRERLAERDDGAAVRDRHAAHYAWLAELSVGSERVEQGRTQRWWLTTLADELDNIRAALGWSIGRGDAAVAQQIAGQLGWFWLFSGRIVEGFRWLEESLACDGDAPLGVRAAAVSWAAMLGVQAGHPEQAFELAVEGIELSQRSGDPAAIGFAHSVFARIHLVRGRLDESFEQLDRAQEGYAAAGDPWSSAMAGLIRARMSFLRGEFVDADATSAVDTFCTIGDHCTFAVGLELIGQMRRATGRYAEAAAALSEALEVCETFGLRGWQCTIATQLGTLALLDGDRAGADRWHRVALELARELALPAAEAAVLDSIGLVHRRDGELDEARRCHLDALAIHERVGAATGVAVSASGLGYVAEQAGEPDEARRQHTVALRHALRLGDRRAVAVAVEGLAGAFAVDGDARRAARLLGHAGRLRSEIHATLPERERVDVDRVADAVRSLLGGDEFAAEADAGRHATIDELVPAGEPTSMPVA